MVCQPVHPESNISHFHPFCFWGSAPWFFIRSRRRPTKSNFKIIIAPSLEALGVRRPTLVNMYLTGIEPYSTSQCTRNQI